MKRLQIRFVILTMTCLLVILTALVTVLNVLSYRSMVKSADWTLTILSENQGRFPEALDANDHNADEQTPHGVQPPSEDEHIPLNSIPADEKEQKREYGHFFLAELPHESRFFSVLLDGDGNTVQIETSHIAAISDDKAINFARNVASREQERGFYGIYRYAMVSETEGLRVIFLDTSNAMVSYYYTLLNSVGIALVLFLVVFVIVAVLSNRILRPIAENYEMQRRFISDAGHELKTPLTIIRADADVLELELGHNEWLEDIQQQTDRLSELTNNLLLLSRMEDAHSVLTLIDFPLSDCVAETVASFKTLAKAKNRDLVCYVEPMLTLRGDERSISHLVSVLLDNAIKYSPENGSICLRLEKIARAAQLTVYNTTGETIPKESLPRLFDRFYRIDSARNSDVGGHGIGLSLAKAIVGVHGGKIQASIPSEKAIIFTVTLPF